LTERLISIIKFSVAVVILPVMIAITAAFFEQVISLPHQMAGYFLWGIISYLILHLFMFEPVVIYEKGQAIVRSIFKFFPPLADFLMFCLPIYAVIFLIVYFLFSLFFDLTYYSWIFLVLVGFSLTLHVVNSVKPLSSRQEDFLKGHYFLSLQLVYIAGIFITAWILHCLVADFSFADFFNMFLRFTKYIYYLAFRQLFL
jgi:hypothetical protein